MPIILLNASEALMNKQTKIPALVGEIDITCKYTIKYNEVDKYHGKETVVRAGGDELGCEMEQSK